ncbi:hypothetical protein ACFY3V_27635 [Streptosporangium sp. NPDC000095]|uniref:hypothetical protein n=1 Tax=Streptosporangium sp. NPDC000095 TaxID=3366184 RepID=UPI00369C3AF8
MSHRETFIRGTRQTVSHLFVKGIVRPSSIGHTVGGTKPGHLALYGFIAFRKRT